MAYASPFLIYIERKINMSELIFFIIGTITGGMTMLILMCCLQVNKINDIESKYESLKYEK